MIRVSATRGREGETFHSPDTQRTRIRDACERNGWQLLDTLEELDISGGKPLEQRPGLNAAVCAIESKRAEVVIAAYLDRLTRDPNVRDAVIDRVEAAGGDVFTVDMGRQTNGTAVEQLTGTHASAVHRYVRRVAAERTYEAQVRAVARGAAPWPRVPPGYLRGEDGVLVADPETAPIIAEAFERRLAGATIKQVRAFLQAEGIDRTFGAVRNMLSSRLYVGEIHFGALVNLDAHEPIVDHDVFRRSEKVVTAGRKTRATGCSHASACCAASPVVHGWSPRRRATPTRASALCMRCIAARRHATAIGA